MENYTLGLALFDYLPVIAAGIGLYLVCRYTAGLADYDSPWIVLMPLIAITGGMIKATWKLLWALQQVNYTWMSDQLFFFLASAYILLAVFVVRCLRAAARGESLAGNWWHWPCVAVAATLAGAFYLMASGGRGWTALLLAVLSIGNLVFLVTLIVHAFRRNNRAAAAAFAASLTLGYVLVGLARMEQTAELQWIEQSINLFNNGLLALGAWALLTKSEQEYA
jgi:hypothetical protein